jgi:hypothetical protein
MLLLALCFLLCSHPAPPQCPLLVPLLLLLLLLPPLLLPSHRGRKRAALLYVVSYSLSCITKHSSKYWVLMVGRLLGGISTSLLFSAFESWAVAAHAQAGFESSLLSDLFTKAVFLGNGLMAIAAGLVGNVLVEDLGLGPVAPFDAAVVVLVLGGIAIHMTWEENYGDKGSSRPLAAQFRQALQIVKQGMSGQAAAAAAAAAEVCVSTSKGSLELCSCCMPDTQWHSGRPGSLQA